jgi:hypothetical protein
MHISSRNQLHTNMLSSTKKKKKKNKTRVINRDHKLAKKAQALDATPQDLSRLLVTSNVTGRKTYNN